MAVLPFTLSPSSFVQVPYFRVNSSSSSGGSKIHCSGNPSESINFGDNGLSCFPEKKSVINPKGIVKIPPPRPRRIILVRHGQSEGNLDETAYTRVADPKIALTEKGKAEAEECGKRIREIIEKDNVPNWKVYFYVSPYRRAHETLKSLGRAFERSRIAGLREETRLREQDFGTLINKTHLQFFEKKESLCYSLNWV